MIQPVAHGSAAEQLGRLFLAAVLVVFLPQLPLGNYIVYPFTILTTWFHEMGHGLTGLLLGNGFERLVIFPDGSGFAETVYPGRAGGLSRALVAAGGPLGPVIIGAALILASSRTQWWKPALLALAAIIALSALIWVRSATGLIVLPAIAAAFGWLALRAPAWAQRFALQFTGVMAAMSMLRDWDYMFSCRAEIGGRMMTSDTCAMQDALILPYWLWALLIIAVSAVIIGATLKYALAQQQRASTVPWPRPWPPRRG